MNYERLTEREDNAIGINCEISDIINRLAELEDKIENGTLVELPTYQEKYAIVKYTFWKNQTLTIARYYPIGIKMNGEIKYAFSDVKSGFITVIQDDFATKAEAEKRLKELRGIK